MARFDIYNPFVDRPPEWPFRKLDDVASRALKMLRSYQLEELKIWAAEVDKAVEYERELYVSMETDHYIDRLVSHGGWELRYLPDGYHATEINIRWLLNNWPSEADDLPDLPSEEDVEDVEALQAALDYDRFQNPIESHHFTPKPAERWWDYQDCIFALLALMKVEEALLSLGWMKNGYGWRPSDTPRVRVEAAADAALDAMEAMGVAEKFAAINLERGIAKTQLERAAVVPVTSPAQEPLPSMERINAARERGRKNRAETYSQIEDFVKAAWRDQVNADPLASEDAFVVAIKAEVANNFKRKANSKGGRKGEDHSIATSSILKWIRNAGTTVAK